MLWLAELVWETHPPVAIYSSYRDDDNVLGWAGVLSPAEDIPARFTRRQIRSEFARTERSNESDIS